MMPIKAYEKSFALSVLFYLKNSKKTFINHSLRVFQIGLFFH